MTDEDRVLLVLYNSAINMTEQAKNLCSKDDDAHRLSINSTLHAQNVLIKLLSHLKGDNEMRHNLRTLYTHAYRQLEEAVTKKNEAKFDEVIELLTELRDALAKDSKEVTNGIRSPKESH